MLWILLKEIKQEIRTVKLSMEFIDISLCANDLNFILQQYSYVYLTPKKLKGAQQLGTRKSNPFVV